MIAFARMLVSAAQKAGMSVPEDPDSFKESKEAHPHFFVFCMLQLGRPVRYHGEHWHWDNAKLIAEIPKEEIMKLTLEDFIARGLSFSS
jgi:hypothetical protein